MKVTLTRGNETVVIESSDELCDANPWYRASFEKQVAIVTERFYERAEETKEARHE